MCGISGFNGYYNPELLNKMNVIQAHRGPDDKGEWISSSKDIGFAHRRLSIIDLSTGGHQPMCNEDGSVWITYNGEIYNYREIRKILASKGYKFKTMSDTEVIIHAYEEWGEDCLNRLNGIFAFAIWDMRKQGLLLARDGLGVKPLYYAETKSGFLFASEIKSLLQCQEVSRELDLIAIHHYLAYLWAPAPETMLKGVKKLPPGQAMIIRDGKIVRRWYFYDLPYQGVCLMQSRKEIVCQLQEQLELAVNRQLVSDVSIGAFLSGGLDSSAVVSMMRRLRPNDPIKCYSIGFAGDKEIEGNPADLPYARQVADHLKVKLHPIIVKPDMIRHLERMLYHLEEPQADPSPINALLIAEQAQKDGIKVLLSGAGGDDIFSGYRRHWAIKMERMWKWLPHVARRGLVCWANNGSVKSSIIRRLRKMFAYADLSSEDRLISYFFWSGEKLRNSLYSRDLASYLANVDTAEPLRESLKRIPNEHDQLNRMLYLEAKHFLADHNLNYTDKTGMAAGVEIRVPLLDIELVEFATKIPSNLKQKGGVGKYIFKKAMEPYLPKNVIYRPKSGFGAPLRYWLRNELREMVEDVLSVHSLKSRGLFEPITVHSLMERDRQGRVDGAYTIFSLVCIELLCRIFTDGNLPVVQADTD